MRIILLIIIGLIPLNFIKIYLYGSLCHYTIGKRCRIGFSLIYCKKVVLENDVRIGNFNLIYNTQSMVMRSGADLGGRNIIKNLTTMTMEQNSKYGSRTI
jgi:hypothetical protein